LSARGNQALRLILDGNLESAFDLSKSAILFGQDSGVFSIFPAQSAMQAAVYLGRTAEVFSFDTRISQFAVTRYVALAYGGSTAGSVEATQRDEIERRLVAGNLDRVSQNRIADLALATRIGDEHTIRTVLVDLALATRIGDEHTIRTVLDELSGTDSIVTVPAVLFSVRRLCAEAARALQNYDEAIRFALQAITDCETIKHRPEGALSHLLLAELLLEHHPEDRDTAIEHLDNAIAELTEMKMQPALERALRHRGLLKA
jgi:hypothetical protein